MRGGLQNRNQPKSGLTDTTYTTKPRNPNWSCLLPPPQGCESSHRELPVTGVGATFNPVTEGDVDESPPKPWTSHARQILPAVTRGTNPPKRKATSAAEAKPVKLHGGSLVVLLPISLCCPPHIDELAQIRPRSQHGLQPLQPRLRLASRLLHASAPPERIARLASS